MAVKKLRTVFMGHSLTLALAVIVVALVNVFGYLFSVNTDFIVSYNEVVEEVSAATARIEAADEVDASMVPRFCTFASFDKDGDLLYGTIDEAEAAQIWDVVEVAGNTQLHQFYKEGGDYYGHGYTIIPHGEEIVVLRYRLATQFADPRLSAIVPSSDWLFVGLLLVQFFAVMLFLSWRMGRNLGRKMAPLSQAARKIEAQDLDFTMAGSGIVEIDQVQDALDHLRLALGESLRRQWQDEKMRQEQLAALAHDLKTPLTIVRGNTDLLQETPLDEEQARCADYIAAGALQMQDYVQRLIEATRSWENTALSLAPVGLNAFLSEVKGQVTGLAAACGITFDWPAAVPDCSLTIDAPMLARALVNVLANAVEHAVHTVALHVSVADGAVTFFIQDDGAGFSADALCHATEPFYMGDASRHSSGHYGIGLHLAATVVEKHQGTLRLSNGEKGGACVTITLPLAVAR